MSIQICGAPCCWGVDDPKNPYLPPWTRVLEEAGKAGYNDCARRQRLDDHLFPAS